MARKHKAEIKGVREGYATPSRILSKKEYAQYQQQRKALAQLNIRQRMKERGKEITFRGRQVHFAGTRQGRFASGFGKVIGALAAKHGVSRALYRQQIPPQDMAGRSAAMKRTQMGFRSGSKGRPKGTYDMRYAQFGGVYGYRKYLASKIREHKTEMIRQATVSPQQQQVINSYEAQQYAQRINPENRIFPDTSGEVKLKGIFDEIDNASNLVP